MLNCQGVTMEEKDLKRASTPRAVILTDELHGEGGGCDRSECNDTEQQSGVTGFRHVLGWDLFCCIAPGHEDKARG